MAMNGALLGDLRVERDDVKDLGRIVEALACAVEIKDSHTGQHLYRSALLASACLEQIDYELSLCDDVGYGFLLHDVGKIGVPDSILTKPGELTEVEWAIMKSHPRMGVQIVEPIGFSQNTLDVISYHHERWDGTGYPEALEGNDIPLAARVFAVADTYDALTTDRPYRAALSKDSAIRYISTEAGARFDAQVVAAFIALVA